MRIGYACLALGVLNTALKGCTLKNATPDNLRSIITNNLTSLENIIDYNIRNEILLFRISSDIIPFASAPINSLNWEELFREQFIKISTKIINNNMRVSMHPGQYTVLNSPNEEVVKRAIEDLKYHAKFLDLLNLNSEHKIILHIGGVYNNKENAIRNFIKNYTLLDANIKKRLVIENDDKSYNIKDVLEISYDLGIPVVYDVLHNKINPYNNMEDDYWIEQCRNTWNTTDGPQKIHYSEQAINKKAGSHSETIEIETFLTFLKSISNKNIDIMLEVKDKNLSAIKCNNCIASKPLIGRLEKG